MQTCYVSNDVSVSVVQNDEGQYQKVIEHNIYLLVVNIYMVSFRCG